MVGNRVLPLISVHLLDCVKEGVPAMELQGTMARREEVEQHAKITSMFTSHPAASTNVKIRNLKGKWKAPLIDIQPRQKQVIAEWRKTVRPLIWQCRTLELHMKDISSQMAQSFESSFLHSSLFSSPPQLGNNSTGHHGAEWKYNFLPEGHALLQSCMPPLRAPIEEYSLAKVFHIIFAKASSLREVQMGH